MEDVVVDIGAQLKEQREKLGYSLLEAAQHTRIRKVYLESIENNMFSDLPGHAYVTGFIKSYAAYLGVDNDALLVQLEEIRLSNEPLPLKPISVIKHQSPKNSKSSSGSGWSYFVLGLLGVLILSCAAYLVSPMFQDEVLSEVASELVVLEKGPLQEPAHKQTETTLVPGVDSNEAEQKATTSLQEEKLPSVAAKVAPLELKPLPFVPAGGSSLRVLALSEGSLIIYVDDRKSHQYKLHDGLDLTWVVRERVKVELAGPGMARFWLGNQELDLGKMESFQLQTKNGD